MLNTECGDCGSDISSGESIYCGRCYDKLENRVKELEKDIEGKDDEIERQNSEDVRKEDEIIALKARVTQLENDLVRARGE